MIQEIPVRFPSEEEAVQEKPNYSERAKEASKKLRDTTVEIDMWWQGWLSTALIIIFVLFLIGYNMRDTTVQDTIFSIQKEEKNIRTQHYRIEEANKSISGSLLQIGKDRETLKQYNLNYQ